MRSEPSLKQYIRISTLAVFVGLSAMPAGADELRPNAWGIYAAPTTHNVSSGSAWQQMESSTDLDVGVFYSRQLRSNLILRFEAKWVNREFTAHTTSEIFPGALLIMPTIEEFVELPVILFGTRTVSLGDAAVRISLGGGGYYAVLVSQEFAVASSLPDAAEPLDAGGYSRYGLLADGGVSLLFDKRSAVFLNFRVQEDLGITGEPENAVALEDMAFGFYAGFEWLF